MDPKELGYYDAHAKEFRGTVKQVGWGSDASQHIRFRVLLEVLRQLAGDAWSGLTLLDFGCGRGDLLPVLQDAGFRGRYIGVEAVPVSFEDARARAAAGKFLFATQIVNENWDGAKPIGAASPDFVLASGSFNATPTAKRDEIYRRLLHDGSRLGVVANFPRSDPRLPKDPPGTIITNTSPEEILGQVDPLKFRRIMRADYLWHDFTVGAARWPSK